MSTPEAGSPKKQRRVAVYALLAVASLLAFLSVFAIWANRQALENDTWTETSTELLEDPDIREAVADFMVDQLFANVDVQAELAQTLPPRLQPLAGPAAGALRGLADRLANEALQRPRVQELWEEANRKAHQTFINVVEHDAEEDVTLDLGAIVGDLGQQLGVDVSAKIPPGSAEIEIVKQDQLSGVQTAVKLLRGAAVFLLVLALVLYGLALYLSRGWRRQVLRSIGFAFILIGVAVLAIRSFAGDALVDSLASTEAAQPAVSSVWEIGTSLLADQGGATIFYGLFILIGAWLAGPGGIARGARRAIAPILENRLVAYPALLLFLLLLFLWSPTPGFQRLPTALLLIALSVVGLEFLRHQAIRDFPGETWEGASERWGSSVRRRLGRGDGPDQRPRSGA
jgi:hypothetical protein